MLVYFSIKVVIMRQRPLRETMRQRPLRETMRQRPLRETLTHNHTRCNAG